MIEIKPLLSDWKQVSKQDAEKFVKSLLDKIMTMNQAEKIKYIESNRLRGIKVEELFD